MRTCSEWPDGEALRTGTPKALSLLSVMHAVPGSYLSTRLTPHGRQLPHPFAFQRRAPPLPHVGPTEARGLIAQ